MSKTTTKSKKLRTEHRPLNLTTGNPLVTLRREVPEEFCLCAPDWSGFETNWKQN